MKKKILDLGMELKQDSYSVSVRLAGSSHCGMGWLFPKSPEVSLLDGLKNTNAIGNKTSGIETLNSGVRSVSAIKLEFSRKGIWSRGSQSHQMGLDILLSISALEQ